MDTSLRCTLIYAAAAVRQRLLLLLLLSAQNHSASHRIDSTPRNITASRSFATPTLYRARFMHWWSFPRATSLPHRAATIAVIGRCDSCSSLRRTPCRW